MVLDVWLQGSRLDGIQLLDILNREHPDLPVVIISGHVITSYSIHYTKLYEMVTARDAAIQALEKIREQVQNIE